MEYILQTANLTRKFGKTVAVDNVSLHIKRGEIYGLIGRNGAGKTTILKMVGGLIRPTSGTVEFMGEPIEKAIEAGKLSKVGTLIESPGLIGNMTGHDNLRLKCIAAGMKHDPEYIHGLLETVGLSDAEFKKAGNYSLGMKQRLGIALALVGGPEVMILDEPINGLDPQGIAEVREILVKLHSERNMTILISSHILEEMSKLVTTCGIIDNGVLLREFDREEMERECSSRIILRSDAPGAAAQALMKVGFTQMKVLDSKTLEITERVDESPLIIRTVVEAGVTLYEAKRGGQTLEEFFFKIVGGARNV